MNHSNHFSSNQTDPQTQTAANDDIGLTHNKDDSETHKPLKAAKAREGVKEGFYDFYLAEHKNITCRRLHFAGSSFGLLGIATAIKTRSPKPLLTGIVAGYACAWVGHFFFEHNKPATFKYPLKSFVSDYRMYGDILRGKLSLKDTSFDNIKQFDKAKQK